MGAVTVIVSGKGGVGKSTTTVALGRSIAESGQKVLLMDFDMGLRTLDRLTGIDKDLVFDISDIINGVCAPNKAIYQVENLENLSVIPASLNEEDIIAPNIMEKLLRVLRPHFDHILIDAPAGVGRGFHSATSGVDRALIVCTPDPVSIRGSVKVHKLMNEKEIFRQRLLINRFRSDYFEKIDVYEDLDKIIDETGVRLIGVIPEDISLTASFFSGVPADTKSKASLAYKRVSRRLNGENVPIIYDKRLFNERML